MDGDHHRGLEISPILIGTLGILAGAIIVATYHMIITSCCQTRRAVDPPRTARISTPNQDMNQERRTSTSPTLRYVKDYNEEICSVCLSEFNEGERIRALPECLHLFHVECIDTWLYSHSNCPLCRTAALAPAQLVLSIPDSGGIQVQQPQEIQPQVILVNEG